VNGTAQEADHYFGQLAGRVTDGLEAAGIPRCIGGVMATNTPWRRPVSDWVAEFRARLADPGLDGKVFTSIALDYRRVAGALDVESTLDGLIRRASRDPTGLTGNRTLWRLREAVAAGVMDADVGAGLEEAFRLLWRVRLEHQAAQSLAGLPPDDSVDPGSLPPLTRRGLKDAFRLIARAQRALGSEMGFRLR